MSPRSSSFDTTSASCPVASMTSFDSKAMGSTQLIGLGSRATGVQFTTTPPTRFFSLSTMSSKAVMFSTPAPDSHAAAMSFEQARGPGVTCRPFSNSSCWMSSSSRILCAGALIVMVFIR